MSDIAMLVAEEYERRLKSSRKGCGGGGGGDRHEVKEQQPEKMIEIKMNPASNLSVLAHKMKNKVNGEVKWMIEPKSQIGVAASDGFFSA